MAVVDNELIAIIFGTKSFQEIGFLEIVTWPSTPTTNREIERESDDTGNFCEEALWLADYVH